MRYVEKLIARKVIDALIEANPGKTLTVSGDRGFDDNETFPHENQPPELSLTDAILASADQYDEAYIFVGGNEEEGFGPFVYLIYGNGNGGWDVISDYSTALEPVLQPILDFIEKEGD